MSSTKPNDPPRVLMAGLETCKISKNFGASAALSEVSVHFAPGQIHAVLGENGAGKSTLMKIIFGLYPPSSGEIRMAGKPVQWSSTREAIAQGIGMVQQHFTLVESMPAIDNIILGAEITQRTGVLLRQQAIRWLEKQLPSPQLAVPWLANVSELSIGQKQRVEILKLLFRQAQFLILDEPTAVLSPPEILDFFSVLRQLRAKGCTLLLVTHKIAEVMEVCDTYTVLRAGRWIESGSVTGTPPEKIVTAMMGRKIPVTVDQRLEPSADLALRVVDLCPGIKNSNMCLSVHRREIVGIAGIEGSGQTELVESILGLRHFTGQISLMGEALQPLTPLRVRHLGLGLIPEDRQQQGLWLEESCYANMAIGLEDRFIHRLTFLKKKLENVTAQWAKDFDVRAGSLRAPVSSLSGGNQQKLIFAREVSGRAPNFLLCHQPTRGVDLGATDLIHRRLVKLRNEGLGILMLSSDLDELLKTCDRIYVLFHARVVVEFQRPEFSRVRIGAAMTGVTASA